MTPSPSLQQLAEAAAVDIVNREYHEDVPSNIYTVRDVILKHLTPLEQERQALVARVEKLTQNMARLRLETGDVSTDCDGDGLPRIVDWVKLEQMIKVAQDNERKAKALDWLIFNFKIKGQNFIRCVPWTDKGTHYEIDLEAIEQAMRKEKV